MKGSAGKVLMIVENFIPWDRRVFNEAKSLKAEGYQVTIIALRDNNQRPVEQLEGIKVYRIPCLTLFEKSWNPRAGYLRKIFNYFLSAIGYITEYLYFTAVSFLLSIYVLWKEGFDCVHVHNPPDTLFIIGLFYKILGKKYVYDHHDLNPELYLSRYNRDKGLMFYILLILEKINLKIADLIIATNKSYKEIEIDRGRISSEKVFIVRNGPVLSNFVPVEPDRKLKELNKTILAYAGVMGPQDGVDYLIRSLYHLVYDLKRKDFFCVIVGTGDALVNLKVLASELQLDDYVLFTGFIPDEDYHRYLYTADICVSPDPSNPLNNHSTWIKVLEYMAFGKSIVSFDLKETRFSAGDAALYATPNDELEFAKKIEYLMDNPNERVTMGQAGKERIAKHLNWDVSSKNLLMAYQSLFN